LSESNWTYNFMTLVRYRIGFVKCKNSFLPPFFRFINMSQWIEIFNSEALNCNMKNKTFPIKAHFCHFCQFVSSVWNSFVQNCKKLQIVTICKSYSCNRKSQLLFCYLYLNFFGWKPAPYCPEKRQLKKNIYYC